MNLPQIDANIEVARLKKRFSFYLQCQDEYFKNPKAPRVAKQYWAIRNEIEKTVGKVDPAKQANFEFLAR